MTAQQLLKACGLAIVVLAAYVLVIPRALYGPRDLMPVNYLPLFDFSVLPATTISLVFFGSFRMWVATTYTSRRAVGEEAYTDERDSHFVACHATSLVHATVLGVPAILISLYLYVASPGPIPPEVMYLPSEALSAAWPEWIGLHNQIKTLGCLFEGFCMCDCLFLLVPGSWKVVGGPANAFHHVAFVIVGMTIRSYSAVPGVAIAMMGGELSTPFLNAFRIKDALGITGPLLATCRVSFAVFFFLVRVVLNTWVVYLLHANRSYLDASAIPAAGQYVLLWLLPVLQLLNFFWFYKIVAFVLRPSKPPPKQSVE
eukprot:SAG22_NODE_4532_length_1242_cov_1.470691_1_plen_314_part_00